ncbi:hypothetical protein [Geminocystis herdmanii]|uniref:hypothetical protein n=1 Tax=Geminocystis herdmanii TaxID=669359 RepID=UPI00034CAACC|nr:hypothetical protein [Geminocystis herdmanii]
MSTEALITGLEYISQVRKQLPDELAIMTEKLTLIKQQIADSIEQNKLKQVEMITLLLTIQEKLKALPETIIQQQSLLQNKMILIANKLKKLDKIIDTQEAQMSPILEGVNKYFEQFENQLKTIKTKHLQLLSDSMVIFNELWHTVEDNYNKMEVSWLEMEQETDILNQKLTSFQQTSQSHFSTTENNLDEMQNTLENYVEDNIINALNNVEETLKQEIENSLENIEDKIQEFNEETDDRITEMGELIKETIADVMESIEESLAIEDNSQEIDDSQTKFVQTSENLTGLMPSIRQLISDLEKAKESLNI